MDDTMARFNESLPFDKTFYEADIIGSIAYAKAIHRRELITDNELHKITSSLQQVLEETNCELRLNKALELLTKELEISKVQQAIKEQVEEKVSKNQRQYLLMEHHINV